MEKSGNDQIVYKGLEGVIAAETKVGYVDGQIGMLNYRGYDINELVEKSNYEEVSYLLLYGKLPNRKEYDDYVKRLKEARRIPEEVENLIREIGKETHPMVTLRTAVSYIGSLDKKESENTYEHKEEVGINLIGNINAMVAAIQRIYVGKDIIKDDPNLNFASSFFYSSLGRKPDPVESKILDTALILHADHGMNASTFSSLVTISTMADMYSAITSAISTLKGPLHGGANEKALQMLQSIGSPENAEKYLQGMIERKERVMGFGHRVYKVYDPRAKVLKKYADFITQKSNRNLYETANRVEQLMISKFGEKGIFPNVDFYSGMIYSSMGFSTEMFTPIFAVARTSGWVARCLEYVKDNKLFRPKAKYVGNKGPLPYIPINERE
ncbi:citrate/2-methylcitrate synthase [Caldiplasma sukawensis]